ncbi:MAG: hypothetical protein NC929_05405 [Candidatus Omnitrophica bacterium]|nr:hypothetical protein [Candidatus Omnitrophota bacterium]
MKKGKDVKIVIGKRVITRDELFKKKEEFHRAQARMPFEEKIAVLVRLQKIYASLKRGKGITVWKI